MKKILVVFLLFSSCAAQQEKEVLDSWIGHTKQNLLLNWGPPSATFQDESIGEIYIYSKEFYMPLSTGTVHYWHHIMMYIKDDKIYSWRTQKNQVPPTRIHLSF